jgi:hypothetical protein
LPLATAYKFKTKLEVSVLQTIIVVIARLPEPVASVVFVDKIAVL